MKKRYLVFYFTSVVVFVAALLAARSFPQDLRKIFYIALAVIYTANIIVSIIVFRKITIRRQTRGKPADAKEYNMKQQEEMKRALEQINKRKL
ncbi:MAG: hypothetical protein HUJ76_10940 [Parasporobacterium sp.]|nr:hypothetical protein [Parasporobacterium sp.]